MPDIKRLKESVDCRHLVEMDLGQPHRRGSKAWQWRCPLHHEQKGYSLVAWSDGWRCFGVCQLSGDAIHWLQCYRQLDFKEACHTLGIPLENNDYQRIFAPTEAPMPALSEPPDQEWQTAAEKVVEYAQSMLWSQQGIKALDYLQATRGFFPSTIRAAKLGYIPGAHHQWRKLFGLTVPCGITIPWFAENMLWGVKVRRAAGDIRYEQVGGGNIAGSLYWVDDMLPRWPVLLVEGEFNCLIALQEARDLICPVSLGSASNSLNARWFAVLATCPTLLVCYDNDGAGEKAVTRLQALTQRAKFIRVPEGKDINEYHLLQRSRHATIYKWLKGCVGDDS